MNTNRFMYRTFVCLAALVLFAAVPGCKTSQSNHTPASQQLPQAASGRSIVIWISLDGFRGDYLDHVDAPFLKKLIAEGASTKHLIPIFPSITFASHSSEATGVRVNEHGIPGNNLYDSAANQQTPVKHDPKTRKDQVQTFPSDPSLLQSEPIWQTATRQGVRVAVFDWPLSFRQQGENASAYFNQKYDKNPFSADRFNHLVDTWKNDNGSPPLRLLMGYTETVDTEGHKHGPNGEGTFKAIAEVDVALKTLFENALAYFKAHSKPGDHIYFLLTTDHGMDEVTYIVNLEVVLDDLFDDNVLIVTDGSVGNIFIDGITDPVARKARAREIVTRLNQEKYLHAWLKSDLPEKWAYNHPTRNGDVIVTAINGYTFNRRNAVAVSKLGPKETPKGMHGYDPDQNPAMHGLMIIWRYPDNFGGKDLGQVDSLRIHPTVAKILGIDPSPKAKAAPLKLD